MYHFTKKMLSLLLVISVLAGMTACAGGSTETEAVTDTAAQTETAPQETEVTTDLPEDLQFDGATCHIFNFDSASWNNQLISSELTGEVLNDATYHRTQKVVERLNIDFHEDRHADWSPAFDAAKPLLMAGDDTYAIMFLVDRNALTMAQEGYIYPLNQMPYVDLEREYWAQSINEDISVAGNLYFSYGDFNLTGYEAVNVLLVNKAHCVDYDLGDHYDLVLEGTWTLDVLEENMKKVAHDANGDGAFDDQDMYGITSHHKQVLPCFWVAAGLRSITKDENDLPVFALPGNENFATFYDRIMNVMYSDNVYYNSKVLPDYANNTLFIEGHALYNVVRVAFMKFYRDMEYDYAIIPYPKFTAEQSQYYSRFEGGSVSFTPTFSTQKELAGAVSELMACESMKMVIPSYYDVMLKNRYARDEKSVEMLDIIYGNRICDLGDTFFNNQVRDGVFAGKFDNNDRNLQSTIKSMEKNVNTALTATIEAFQAVDAIQ